MVIDDGDIPDGEETCLACMGLGTVPKDEVPPLGPQLVADRRSESASETWARLMDVYTATGTLDLDRADWQLGFIEALIAMVLARTERHREEIQRAMCQGAVDDHERRLHGRKDFH